MSRLLWVCAEMGAPPRRPINSFARGGIARRLSERARDAAAAESGSAAEGADAAAGPSGSAEVGGARAGQGKAEAGGAASGAPGFVQGLRAACENFAAMLETLGATDGESIAREFALPLAPDGKSARAVFGYTLRMGLDGVRAEPFGDAVLDPYPASGADASRNAAGPGPNRSMDGFSGAADSWRSAAGGKAAAAGAGVSRQPGGLGRTGRMGGAARQGQAANTGGRGQPGRPAAAMATASAPAARHAPPRAPITDLFEEGGFLRVVAELPGVSGGDLRCTAAPHLLHIETLGVPAYGKSLALPREIRPESLSYTLANGILEVRLTLAGGPDGKAKGQ